MSQPVLEIVGKPGVDVDMFDYFCVRPRKNTLESVRPWVSKWCVLLRATRSNRKLSCRSPNEIKLQLEDSWDPACHPLAPETPVFPPPNGHGFLGPGFWGNGAQIDSGTVSNTFFSGC